MKNIKSSIYDNGEEYDKISNYTLDNEIWCKLTEGKKSILELCCGTGRVIMKLLPTHNDIAGIDNSAAMLARAKAKTLAYQAKVKLYRRNITRFNLGRTFSSILLINSSFSHLQREQEVLRFLTCLKKHMTDDSEFILETSTENILPYYNLSNRLVPYPGASFVDNEDGKAVEVLEKSVFNSGNKFLKQELFWYKEKKLIRKRSIHVRIFAPEEIQQLFTGNGFNIAQQYGDYNLEPFNSSSRRYITVIKKKR